MLYNDIGEKSVMVSAENLLWYTPHKHRPRRGWQRV